MEEDALEIVMSLIDQMHALRNRLRLMARAIEAEPEEVRLRIARFICETPCRAFTVGQTGSGLGFVIPIRTQDPVPIALGIIKLVVLQRPEKGRKPYPAKKQ